jgi:glycosyltransferase involved in cell wall biosynthesis
MTVDLIAPLPRPARLKVALITETWPPEINGVAHSIFQLATGLQKRGHSLLLIRPAQRSLPALALADQELLVRGFAIPRYPQLQGGMPAYGAIRHQLQSFAPDVVHIVTEGPLGLAALYAARSLGLPISSGFHSPFHEFSRFFGLGFLLTPIKAYLRFFHRRTHVTCVPSAKTAADLAAMGLSSVQVVGRGVNGQQFNPVHRCADLRTQWQATHQTTVLLYVGRLSPEKNLDLVVAAFRELQVSQPLRDVRLVFVGDGPDRARLETLAPEVVFAGMQTGVALSQYYASADVFCFASQVETFGNVVLEAMASGLPVLAFDDACAAQVLTPDHSGWLIPLGNEAEFCQTASRLLGLSRLHEMGVCARAAVLGLDWLLPVTQLETAFEQARLCQTSIHHQRLKNDILVNERSETPCEGVVK